MTILEAMTARAVEQMAMNIRETLVQEMARLNAAGWDYDTIVTLQDEALRQNMANPPE